MRLRPCLSVLDLRRGLFIAIAVASPSGFVLDRDRTAMPGLIDSDLTPLVLSGIDLMSLGLRFPNSGCLGPVTGSATTLCHVA